MKPTTKSKPSPDEFLQIDELRLDLECINQPKLYHEWSQKLANAKLDLDDSKNALDLLEAKTDQKLRAELLKAGEKVTESAISKMLTVDDKIQTARMGVIEAKHAVDVILAVVTALDQKKNALRMLVDLHGYDYFSDVAPKTPAGRESMQQSTKAAVRQLGRREKDSVRR